MTNAFYCGLYAGMAVTCTAISGFVFYCGYYKYGILLLMTSMVAAVMSHLFFHEA